MCEVLCIEEGQGGIVCRSCVITVDNTESEYRRHYAASVDLMDEQLKGNFWMDIMYENWHLNE